MEYRTIGFIEMDCKDRGGYTICFQNKETLPNPRHISLGQKGQTQQYTGASPSFQESLLAVVKVPGLNLDRQVAKHALS